MIVKFTPAKAEGDTYRIDVIINGEYRGTVNFVDPNRDGGNICRCPKEFGWRGSKMQAQGGAAEIQEMYDEGRIA